MTQWGPGLFQVIETSDVQPRRWHIFMQPIVHIGEPNHLVSFHVLGTSGEADLPDLMKARLLGHFLLMQLPDEGMGEAVESLTRMWDFYRKTPTYPPALPTSWSIPVRVTGSYVEPVYPVTEE